MLKYLGDSISYHYPNSLWVSLLVSSHSFYRWGDGPGQRSGLSLGLLFSPLLVLPLIWIVRAQRPSTLGLGNRKGGVLWRDLGLNWNIDSVQRPKPESHQDGNLSQVALYLTLRGLGYTCKSLFFYLPTPSLTQQALPVTSKALKLSKTYLKWQCTAWTWVFFSTWCCMESNVLWAKLFSPKHGHMPSLLIIRSFHVIFPPHLLYKIQSALYRDPYDLYQFTWETGGGQLVFFSNYRLGNWDTQKERTLLCDVENHLRCYKNVSEDSWPHRSLFLLPSP